MSGVIEAGRQLETLSSLYFTEVELLLPDPQKGGPLISEDTLGPTFVSPNFSRYDRLISSEGHYVPPVVYRPGETALPTRFETKGIPINLNVSEPGFYARVKPLGMSLHEDHIDARTNFTASEVLVVAIQAYGFVERNNRYVIELFESGSVRYNQWNKLAPFLGSGRRGFFPNGSRYGQGELVFRTVKSKLEFSIA